MDLPKIAKIKTADEAEELAKDWQTYAGENDLSYGELVYYQNYFEELAEKFNLTEVFKENAII